MGAGRCGACNGCQLDALKTPFGVSRICEIYGSSEGNITFLNLLNLDKTIGAEISKVAQVRYDNENDEIVGEASGRCIEVPFSIGNLLENEKEAQDSANKAQRTL